MLARKDLFPALQNNFPVFGPVSLMVRPEIDDALVFSTKVYQHYLGNATIDRDHIKELTKVTNHLCLILILPIFHLRRSIVCFRLATYNNIRSILFQNMSLT